MSSQFNLIDYLPWSQEKKMKFQLGAMINNDVWDKHLWGIRAAVGIKLESSLSSLGNLSNYAQMVLSLDGHAIFHGW
jgi:hypothetical protein